LLTLQIISEIGVEIEREDEKQEKMDRYQASQKKNETRNNVSIEDDNPRHIHILNPSRKTATLK